MQRHRPFGPDARRDAARRGRQGAPPLHPLERRPLGGRSGRARAPSRASARSPATSPCPASPRRSCSGSQRHEPEIFARVATVLLPKDYVRLLLTGDKASEMSDAAGTLWLDVADARLVGRAAGARPASTASQMPELVEGSGADRHAQAPISPRAGACRREVVAGRRRRRQRRAALRRRRGRAGRRLRLARHLGRALRRQPTAIRRNPAGAVHAFCHAVPGTWHQMGVLALGRRVRWTGWRGVTAAERGRPVARARRRRRPAPSSILFLPYLSGERTPHNDVAVPRRLLRPRPGASTRSDMTQAVLEGVAFAFKRLPRRADHAAGTEPSG